ncbi:helix-turn-helix domain-containing protein [Halalkalibacter alkalisediminis]|uniref:Helix-turn-helix domain-containing protein n=1 Tax=Halalkalibacter alkalisediminis TaxID=935616 RepID=A0ABV6NI62_9BACI|nr:helix-turn-helix domain-containing protein [Halalkalibacter alkalisediminis]
MNVRQAITATILNGFNGERSIYGAFHLLKGKKSAQTIQDGALFGLNSYFGLFPELTRAQLEEDVRELIENGQATLLEQDRLRLTEFGKVTLKENVERNRCFSDLRGWHYHPYTEEVWLRLSLFIQTLTNIVSGNRRFYPITHNIRVQAWVKNHIPIKERQQFLQATYDELFDFLSACNEQQALVFVHQLSGINLIGLTRLQLSEKIGVSLDEVNLFHISTIHRLINSIESKESQYSYLSIFIKDLKRDFVLTQSARQTYDLLEQGKTLDSICQIRQLKRSTIEDHIVEIAISNPHFSIRAFVTKELEETILSLSETLQTSRLRELKEKMESKVSYFMIRLVLARKKVNDEA